MRIVSWNVNGLRSLVKSRDWEWLINESSDVFCLQEIKSEEGQLEPGIRAPQGYFAYFNSSRERKGYSGVAIYTKRKPDGVRFDVLADELNTEGRLIEAVFGDVVLLNVYFPNGGGSPERLDYKLRFYDAFLEYIEKLRDSGKSVIFCGDVNVAHEEIDLARPKENSDHVGFLPEERAWFDEVVNHGYIDVFRHFYPTKTGAYTYWDMVSRARDRNDGWRLDYFVVSPDLAPRLKGFEIMSQVYGSDHCPIVLDIDI